MVAVVAGVLVPVPVPVLVLVVIMLVTVTLHCGPRFGLSGLELVADLSRRREVGAGS